MKGKLGILKILVMLGLLTILLTRIDIAESIMLFTHLNIPAIGLICFVTFWLVFISVLKWRIFLKSLGLWRPFWSLYGFYLVGYFFSNFLPSNIGGDVVRVALTAKGRETYASSFVAVFMERLTGIIATLVLAFLALPLVLWKFEFRQGTALIMLPALLIGVFLGVLLFLKPEFFQRLMPKNQMIRKALEKVKEVLVLIQSFRKHRQVLVNAMALSILFNLAASLNVYVIAGALKLDTSLLHLFILVPLILLISSIPLSINAIGIAESAYVLCLGFAGLSASEALSIALLIRAKTLMVSLLGGLLFLAYKKRHGFEAIKKEGPSAKRVVMS